MCSTWAARLQVDPRCMQNWVVARVPHRFRRGIITIAVVITTTTATSRAPALWTILVVAAAVIMWSSSHPALMASSQWIIINNNNLYNNINNNNLYYNIIIINIWQKSKWRMVGGFFRFRQQLHVKQVPQTLLLMKECHLLMRTTWSRILT